MAGDTTWAPQVMIIFLSGESAIISFIDFFFFLFIVDKVPRFFIIYFNPILIFVSFIPNLNPKKKIHFYFNKEKTNYLKKIIGHTHTHTNQRPT